jgi:hypothetical protein
MIMVFFLFPPPGYATNLGPAEMGFPLGNERRQLAFHLDAQGKAKENKLVVRFITEDCYRNYRVVFT